jgi:hypothetical protein
MAVLLICTALRTPGQDETIYRRADTISPLPRSRPETNNSYKETGSNGGFGHVGIHRQIDL